MWNNLGQRDKPRQWEPEDFIEVLKGIESLYYKPIIQPPSRYDFPLYRFEWSRSAGSLQEQLDLSNDWLLDWARTIVPRESRLSLMRIEYASPGGIDLVGLGDACKAIEGILDRLIKLFTERHLRRERDKQETIETELKQESLRAAKIENALKILSLRRDFGDISEELLISLTVRDQDKLIPRIAERKLIAVATVDDEPPETDKAA
jgi:hypothetical protein